MLCGRCAAETTVLNGEIAIHFPGLEGLDKPIVWVFPKLAVCLACGCTQFTVPERELQLLNENVSTAIPQNEHETLERALKEYRIRNWDPSPFCDLPANIQAKIRNRAKKLKEAEDRLKASVDAA